jgi:hypothetical protein
MTVFNIRVLYWHQSNSGYQSFEPLPQLLVENQTWHSEGSEYRPSFQYILGQL